MPEQRSSLGDYAGAYCSGARDEREREEETGQEVMVENVGRENGRENGIKKWIMLDWVWVVLRRDGNWE